MKKFDVIIIGAGPSGMTSALYASRAGLSVLVIDKGLAGGQMNNTAGIENYPGFKNVIGHKLGKKMYQSTMRFGAKYTYGNVQSISSPTQDKKIVTTDLGNYESKALIIATGAKQRHLGIKGETKYAGHGVSYCAVCDGNFFKNKPVIVVGGGDSAFTEAIYLSHICSSVTIMVRKSQPQAEKSICNQVHNIKNIHIKYNTELQTINGDGKNVNSVTLKSGKTMPISAIFIYIGMIPVTQMLNKLPQTEKWIKNGWIKTNDHMQTILKGIYATGDVRYNQLRQVATAIGDGAVAGHTVYQDLERRATGK